MDTSNLRVINCNKKRLLLTITGFMLMAGSVLQLIVFLMPGWSDPLDKSFSAQPWSSIFLAKKKMACFPSDTITMLITNGRLGNRITEYASVWSSARLYGLRPFVSDDCIEILDNVFEGLSVPPFSEFLERKTSCRHVYNIDDVIGRTEYMNRSVNSLESIVLKARKTGKIILVGDRNVMGETIIPLASKLHEEFRYKPELVDGAQMSLSNFRNQMLSARNISRTEQVIFVGIHVRRTYYDWLVEMKYGFKGEPREDYYLHAVQWMRSTLWNETTPRPLNIAFVVVSDDPHWCKKVLIPALTDGKKRKPSLNDNMGKYDVFWGGNNDTRNPQQDLVLLSSCNHSIIGHGTFGLWSALMAGGKTVVYDITWSGENKDNHELPYTMVFAAHMENWVTLF